MGVKSHLKLTERSACVQAIILGTPAMKSKAGSISKSFVFAKIILFRRERERERMSDNLYHYCLPKNLYFILFSMLVELSLAMTVNVT